MADLPNVAPTNIEDETRALPSDTENSLEGNATSHFSFPSRRNPTGSRVTRRTTRSPQVDPYPNPITVGGTPNRARRIANARRWGWLPTVLNTWRNAEGIRTTTEPMDTCPYTQEPMHHTVPMLAARLHRHEDRLDEVQTEQNRQEDRLNAMEVEQHETRLGWMHLAQGRIAQIYQDQEDLTEAMDATHDQVVENWDEIAALRLRVEQCELRSQEAEQHSQMLEQRLIIAEENARQTGRLAEVVDRLSTLLPQLVLHQD